MRALRLDAPIPGWPSNQQTIDADVKRAEQLLEKLRRLAQVRTLEEEHSLAAAASVDAKELRDSLQNYADTCLQALFD